ncbi:MAG: hypothetical protein Q7S45_00455 [Candidatus Curtissbacteria bacterium]|nr:hypothetical protein [Candidatus Curtissbacteria bacterium]
MNTTAKKITSDDSQKVKGDQAVQPRAKEQEPADGRAQEAAAITEIREVSDSHDKEALRLVRESMPETVAGLPKIEIPPDVADAGVMSPEQEAEEVLTSGPIINIDILEKEYKEGLKMRADGKTDHEKTVFGTASLVALALWVGRMMKLAHKHTMRIVFRKPSFVSTSAKASVDKKATEGKPSSVKTSEGKEVKDAD